MNITRVSFHKAYGVTTERRQARAAQLRTANEAVHKGTSRVVYVDVAFAFCVDSQGY